MISARTAYRSCPDARRGDDCLAIVNAFSAAHPSAFQGVGDAAAVDALCHVVRGMSLEKRTRSAWAAWDGCRLAGYYDPAPPPEAWDAVLHCCASQRLPERALNLLDEMRSLQVPRSPDTYAAVLKAVSTAPQWHRSYRLLADDVLDSMEGDRVAPSPAVYTALVTCAGACGAYVAATAALVHAHTHRAHRPPCQHRSCRHTVAQDGLQP